MLEQDIFNLATGGYSELPQGWMSATALRNLIFDDPGIIWLENYGEENGFKPDSSPYDFSKYIWGKGNEFESKWMAEMAPDAVCVCSAAFEVKNPDKVKTTIELIEEGVPVIAQPALWWAPERICGVPDLIVKLSWFKGKFQGFSFPGDGAGEHYLVIDLKFKSQKNLNKKDLYYFRSQIKLYSFMLGEVQGHLPSNGFIITRDDVQTPLPFAIDKKDDDHLWSDLADFRDRYEEIRLNGSHYRPWTDDIVKVNIKRSDGADEKWSKSKKIIATEKVAGGDTCLLYEISQSIKVELIEMGFENLSVMVDKCPDEDVLEKCKNIGPAKSKRIKAILRANKDGIPVKPAVGIIPKVVPFEFFVDFEYFENTNVDFDKEWPDLSGCPMVFMIGVGWADDGKWEFKHFFAERENQDCEREILEAFIVFLNDKTDGEFLNPDKTQLFHWHHPEKSQSKRAADRHSLDDDHPLRNLPWYDLEKVFLDNPCAIPGVWNFKLKNIARALGNLDPILGITWPGDLDEGLKAMVMGWESYKKDSPQESHEARVLAEYLQADCRALWCILRWLRSFN